MFRFSFHPVSVVLIERCNNTTERVVLNVCMIVWDLTNDAADETYANLKTYAMQYLQVITKTRTSMHADDIILAEQTSANGGLNFMNATLKLVFTRTVLNNNNILTTSFVKYSRFTGFTRLLLQHCTTTLSHVVDVFLFWKHLVFVYLSLSTLFSLHFKTINYISVCLIYKKVIFFLVFVFALLLTDPARVPHWQKSNLSRSVALQKAFCLPFIWLRVF